MTLRTPVTKRIALSSSTCRILLASTWKSATGKRSGPAHLDTLWARARRGTTHARRAPNRFTVFFLKLLPGGGCESWASEAPHFVLRRPGPRSSPQGPAGPRGGKLVVLQRNRSRLLILNI
eukprot:1311967-Pyramimonas_sp.AAC.1